MAAQKKTAPIIIRVVSRVIGAVFLFVQLSLRELVTRCKSAAVPNSPYLGQIPGSLGDGLVGQIVVGQLSGKIFFIAGQIQQPVP